MDGRGGRSTSSATSVRWLGERCRGPSDRSRGCVGWSVHRSQSRAAPASRARLRRPRRPYVPRRMTPRATLVAPLHGAGHVAAVANGGVDPERHSLPEAVVDHRGHELPLLRRDGLLLDHRGDDQDVVRREVLRARVAEVESPPLPPEVRELVAERHIIAAGDQQQRTIAKRGARRMRQAPCGQLRRAAVLVVERMLQHCDACVLAREAQLRADLEVAGNEPRACRHGREFRAHGGIEFVPAGEIGGMEIA